MDEDNRVTIAPLGGIGTGLHAMRAHLKATNLQHWELHNSTAPGRKRQL